MPFKDITRLKSCQAELSNDVGAYVPTVAATFVFDRHSYVEDDVVTRLVLQNLQQHLPIVKISIALGEVVETTMTTYLFLSALGLNPRGAEVQNGRMTISQGVANDIHTDLELWPDTQLSTS